MQRSVILLMLILFSQIGFGQPSTTNEQSKLTVYIWEFSTQHIEEDQKKHANRLTNDFETEITKSGFYQVIEIRERNRLEEQRELQQLIFNIEELSDEERNNLQEQKAEAVFFGKLIYNEDSKEYTLEVKLQHLDGRLLRKGSLYLNQSNLMTNDNRREEVRKLFEDVHEDIFAEQRKALERQKKEKYELISQKLNQHIMRTEDLTTQFRRLDLSMLSQEYLDEYNQSIYSYDESIKDLLKNHTQYESSFRNVWGANLGDELTNVFEKTLDFHERYIFKSLNKRNEQMAHFAKALNKKEKQELEKELKQEKKAFEETMTDQWPVIKSDIHQFLRNLQGKLK